MYQDPIHIEYSRLVDEEDRRKAVADALWRKLQRHLHEHCFRGESYSSQLDRECFDAWEKYEEARQALSNFARRNSFYVYSF